MPNFQHDCSKCEHLGSLGTLADFYRCGSESSVELVCRFSDEPSDYHSIAAMSHEVTRYAMRFSKDLEPNDLMLHFAISRSTTAIFGLCKTRLNATG